MGFFRRLSGKDAAKASIKSGEIGAQASRDASALFDPLAAAGQQGIDQANFLTDPQAQFDFLQNNPLFDLSLQNANRQTNQLAASRGRLSSGDTLQQLSNNVLLASQPLIQDQKQSIGDLINLGAGTASNQGNLLLGEGASLAGGIVGSANARQQGSQNLLNLGGQLLGSDIGQSAVTGAGNLIKGLFSDPSLKENIKLIGNKNGFNLYSWTWNKLASSLGLNGSSYGVMANEVKLKRPEAISIDRGFMKVDYNMIGVN